MILSSLAIEVIIGVLGDIGKCLSGSLATKILILCHNCHQILINNLIMMMMRLLIHKHRIVPGHFPFDWPQRYMALVIDWVDGVAWVDPLEEFFDARILQLRRRRWNVTLVVINVVIVIFIITFWVDTDIAFLAEFRLYLLGFDFIFLLVQLLLPLLLLGRIGTSQDLHNLNKWCCWCHLWWYSIFHPL